MPESLELLDQNIKAKQDEVDRLNKELREATARVAARWMGLVILGAGPLWYWAIKDMDSSIGAAWFWTWFVAFIYCVIASVLAVNDKIDPLEREIREAKNRVNTAKSNRESAFHRMTNKF